MGDKLLSITHKNFRSMTTVQLSHDTTNQIRLPSKRMSRVVLKFSQRCVLRTDGGSEGRPSRVNG